MWSPKVSIKAHRSGSSERVILQGMPVTPKLRMVVDVARGDDETLKRVLRAARFSAAELARLPSAILALGAVPTRTPVEDSACDVVGRGGLRAPREVKAAFRLASGTISPDLRRPEPRLIVDVDSAEWHDDPLAQLADRERQAELRGARRARVACARGGVDAAAVPGPAASDRCTTAERARLPAVPGHGQIRAPGAQEDRLALDGVAHRYEALRDAGERSLARVLHEPARAAHGRDAVEPVRAEAALAVAPELAHPHPGPLRARPERLAQLQVDDVVGGLGDDEYAAEELRAVGGLARSRGGGQPHAALAGVDLGADGDRGHRPEALRGRGGPAPRGVPPGPSGPRPPAQPRGGGRGGE